jgi:hypothetical protein
VHGAGAERGGREEGREGGREGQGGDGAQEGDEVELVRVRVRVRVRGCGRPGAGRGWLGARARFGGGEEPAFRLGREGAVEVGGCEEGWGRWRGRRGR